MLTYAAGSYELFAKLAFPSKSQTFGDTSPPGPVFCHFLGLGKSGLYGFPFLIKEKRSQKEDWVILTGRVKKQPKGLFSLHPVVTPTRGLLQHQYKKAGI